MLPDIRSDEHLYAVPKFDLGKDDVKDFMNELKGFHEQFADCFQQRDQYPSKIQYAPGSQSRWSGLYKRRMSSAVSKKGPSTT